MCSLISCCFCDRFSRAGLGSSVGPFLAIKGRETLLLTLREIEPLIVFSMHIVAPDETRTTLLRMLGSLLGPTRVAAGCREAHLYADLDNRKTLLFVEEWDSREQFECNLDPAKLNTIVAAIELSSHAPVVRVDSVEREEGVDALALHRVGFGGGA
jgi:quinol monooxygenase YgiN